MEVSIKYYFDKRRALAEKKYPLKIMLYVLQKNKQKLYKTPFSFTEEEYIKIYSSRSKQYLYIREELDNYINSVKNLVSEFKPFDIDKFESYFFNKKITSKNVQALYSEKISELNSYGKIRTGNTYKDSLKSIEIFLKLKNKKIDELKFDEINEKWLNEYDNYYINVRKCSVNTLGIYKRCLRAIFNTAIKDQIIDANKYPFGKRKHSIKTTLKLKQVLYTEEIKILESFKCDDEKLKLAKDFWLLSYYCCGMNFTDFAFLTKENFHGDSINFFRRKSSNTKTQDIEINIDIFPKSKEIIDRLANFDNYYVFNIIAKNDSDEQIIKLIDNARDEINNKFKKILKLCNITKRNINYNNARHSWATNAISNGVSIALIKEKLGHTSIATTSNYIATLPIKNSHDMIKTVFYE